MPKSLQRVLFWKKVQKPLPYRCRSLPPTMRWYHAMRHWISVRFVPTRLAGVQSSKVGSVYVSVFGVQGVGAGAEVLRPCQ